MSGQQSGGPPPAGDEPDDPGAGGYEVDERADRLGRDAGGSGGSGAGRASGLRDPAAAMRGLGAGTLLLEGVVLLLAIQPIRVLGGRLSGFAVVLVVALAVVAFVLAGIMRRRWAWHAGTAFQACVVLAGFAHWSLAVIGVLFAGVWAYATSVRRTVLR
jgi:hypothetical protein